MLHPGVEILIASVSEQLALTKAPLHLDHPGGVAERIIAFCEGFASSTQHTGITDR